MTTFQNLLVTPVQWLVILIGGIYLVMIYIVEKEYYFLNDYFKTLSETNFTFETVIEHASRID